MYLYIYIYICVCVMAELSPPKRSSHNTSQNLAFRGRSIEFRPDLYMEYDGVESSQHIHTELTKGHPPTYKLNKLCHQAKTGKMLMGKANCEFIELPSNTQQDSAHSDRGCFPVEKRNPLVPACAACAAWAAARVCASMPIMGLAMPIMSWC